jgi:DNA-binding transcriptional LysR family regulator
MMILLPKTHKLALLPQIRAADLVNENYVMRALCEFAEPAEAAAEPAASSWKAAYKSDRDDWVFAMIASGFGFGFVPYHSAPTDRFAVVPLVEPELWRQVHLTTVLGRPQTPAVGALVHEIMKRNWPREQRRA